MYQETDSPSRRSSRSYRPECKICTRLFRDPRVMPCGHTFCRECLEQLPSYGFDMAMIRCPLCNRCMLTSEIENSPRNYEAVDAVERCEEDEEGSVAEASIPEQPRDKCVEHGTVEVEFFCNEKACQRSVCNICVVSSHKWHNLMSIADRRVEVTADYDRLVRELRAALEKLQTVCREKRRFVDSIDDKLEDDLAAANSYVDSAIAALERRRLDLLLTALRNANSTISKADCNEELTAIRDGERCLQSMAELLRGASLAHLMEFKGKLEKECARCVRVASQKWTEPAYESSVQESLTTLSSERGNPHELTESDDAVYASVVESQESIFTEEAETCVLFCVGGTAACEVDAYEPSWNRWVTVSCMQTSRRCAAAAVLDGKLIVSGGVTNRVQNCVDQFDPLTASWTSLPRMTQDRWQHALVNLNGSVYAIGGLNDGALKSVEFYRPQSGTSGWSRAPRLNHARCGLAAASLQNKIIVAGGFDSSHYLSSCEVFDAAEGGWCLRKSLNIGRALAAIAVHNSAIYVFGGCNRRNGTLGSIEQYDAAGDRWTLLTERLLIARSDVAATTIGDCIYVVGGSSREGSESSVECFNPFNRQCHFSCAMPVARDGHSVTSVRMPATAASKLLQSATLASNEAASNSFVINNLTSSLFRKLRRA